MKVNEIFYSLQGEGYYTGTPAVFIRLSGCNLRCPFCDTQHHVGHDMTESEIVQAAARYPARHVVITGGEPALQLSASLVSKLHAEGKYVAVETNGTHALPDGVDWVTLSPKDAFVSAEVARVVLTRCDELKCVYTGQPLPDYSHISARHRFVQPCAYDGDPARTAEALQATIAYCLQHPAWRLSLQTHKYLGIR